ncbi:tRNA pseudouridine(38-40) synthase TruA [Helicobacter sp. 23-1048]
MRLLAKIAYDGSAFSGFAIQPDSHIHTIEGKLSKVLQSVGIDSVLLYAGRTDKGVHASGQMISFESEIHWNLVRLKELLNQKLYPHIYCKCIWRVPNDFHPRYNALWREYRYVATKKMPNVLCARFVGFEDYGDMSRVRESLGYFIGEHNFRFFKKQGTLSKSDTRHIFRASCYTYRECLVVKVRGNGFLRAQVRLMLGTIFAFGRGEIAKADLLRQIDAKERVFWQPISPNGLYLSAVGYEIFSSKL